MKLDAALKIARLILKKTDISELSFTEAKEQSSDKAFDYDITITENLISSVDMRVIDRIIGDYENVEMEIDLYHDMIRIFEVEPEKKENSQ